MLEEIEAVESRPALIDLSDQEVETLRALGRDLASKTAWWGGASLTQPIRSVIAVDSVRPGRYQVTFRDVIGAVRVGTKQIHVRPKIPFAHFIYIVNRSDLAPRLSASDVSLNEGNDFGFILARWCVDAAEKLLRRGLHKDYSDITDSLMEVRGRILPHETALLNFMGVAQAVCEFQDFSDDTPLNRVVRAACQRISCLPGLDNATCARARQVAFRMDRVGPLRPYDVRAKIDRLSVPYSTVLPLAVLVLAGLGIATSVGCQKGSAFLIRTPELIEDGLRSVLSNGLKKVRVTKRKLQLGDTGLSINPDLIFGDALAVGDVKYRLLERDWSRSDLNQIVTFATGFRVRWAALFGFSTTTSSVPPRVPIGNVEAVAFSWRSGSDCDPASSASKLVEEVAFWLRGRGVEPH